MKRSSICHLNIAAGTAPMDIKKILFFSKKLSIFYLPIKKPNAKAITPKAIEIKNNFNAKTNCNFKIKSNKSLTKVEKVLKLPKKPIKKNNTNLSEKLYELILGKIERNKPRKKEADVLIIEVLK